MKVKTKKIRGITVFNILMIIILILTIILRFNIVRAVVDGESMANTYHHGDTVWVVKNMGKPYQAGEVVVFDNPYGHKQDAWYNIGELTHFEIPVKYIKRVVAVEGDEVKIDGDYVEVNGEVVNHSIDGSIQPDKAIKAEFTVEPGQYVVLGDNRLGSRDSRHFGVIQSEQITGKVKG